MTVTFETQVADFSLRHGLFPHTGGETILVALSGGGDSVALLAVLLRLSERFPFHVEAAHLNHALRGDESEGDERFVRDLCASLGVPLTVERLPEGAIAEAPGSVETAAREARSAFLIDTARSRGAARIATGHTLDDQAETLLQRIIRGTGPSGLAGILPNRDNLWIRPLLGSSRADARNFLEREGLTCRRDSSNDDPSYFRNRIRLELLPFMKERFSPGITGALTRLAELSAIQEDYFEGVTEEAFRACSILSSRYKILLEKEKFLDYHNVVKQRIVRRCLELLEGKGRDADMDEVERIITAVENGEPAVDVTVRVKCGTASGIAALALNSEQYDPVAIALPGTTEIPQGNGVIRSVPVRPGERGDGLRSIVVTSLLIGRYGTLTVGPLRAGERMVPFGMKRGVKIRDCAAALSMPRFLRDMVPVVRAGAVPVWVPGIKSSEVLRQQPEPEPGEAPVDRFMLTLCDGIVWSNGKPPAYSGY
jgi:tRNA(Ile)-lysidine synthase